MCGRFASTLPAERLAEAFAIDPPWPAWQGDENIGPTGMAPVIRRHPQSGAWRLDLLQFGLTPHFWKTGDQRPFNARGETVARLGIFRGAFAARRCLVPVTAWYEWKPGTQPKQPYRIALAPNQAAAPGGATGLMALGGIWEGYRSPEGAVVRSFAIVTMPAIGHLAELHARMPLVLAPSDWGAWVNAPADQAAGLLKSAPEAWFLSSPADRSLNKVGGGPPASRPDATAVKPDLFG